MRKAALLAIALAFIGSDPALAAPVAVSAGKTVISNADQDLTLVRRRKRRVVRRRSVAPSVSNPTVTPSGQNPAVDVGTRARTGSGR